MTYEHKITIYHVNDMQHTGGCDYSICLQEIYTGVIQANDDFDAAAKAWVNEVGLKKRDDWLKNAEDPSNEARPQMEDPEKVKPEMSKTHITGNPGYLLDLIAEAWIIEANCDEEWWSSETTILKN